jgi:hypothetical protein
MNDDIRPSVDPWDLLIEHNKRIQQLEQQIKLLQGNERELIKAVTHAHELYDINKRTLDKLIENQQACSALLADVLNRSTPSASGNH